MCCNQDSNAQGCCVAEFHVTDYYDANHLRGFIKTLPRVDVPSDGDYGVYALDCEMCYTTQGLELTRVTVVNKDLETVYDTLVKPKNIIIDYNTR